MSDSPYKMTISLNVLNHLGINLYSNIPAVLAEVIANAWDADATVVNVEFSKESQTITVSDNGIGMNRSDINQKYLHVGYQRRKVDGILTKRNRMPMGRKGIGKLSLFSIADEITIYSKKIDSEGQALILDSREIVSAIEQGGEMNSNIYRPKKIGFENTIETQGTTIIIKELKNRFRKTSILGLEKRISRRFGRLGDNFTLTINGEKVTFYDREYFDKIQYLFQYGDFDYSQYCDNISEIIDRKNNFNDDGLPENSGKFNITGWIGCVEKVSHLGGEKDVMGSLNKITIFVRGKVAQEDILHEYRIGGIFTKYVCGEIYADFIDADTEEDIATSSRQKIIEDDLRYVALRSFIGEELKFIWNKTNKLNQDKGTKAAFSAHQNIKTWYDELLPGHKQAAKKLFGRINQLRIDDAIEKRRLFVSSILAFESLKLRSLLHKIEDVSVENLPDLKDIFLQLDDLEASAYYQTVKQRLEVISKLTGLVDDNARERALQEHLYQHLWLMDPSWERATHTKRMETRIYKALNIEYNKLSEEQKSARLDIYYATTANKHVIIELKRSDRSLSTDDLTAQIRKYRSAVKKVLKNANRNEPFEFICVVGKPLNDWRDIDGEQISRKSFDALDARIVRYEELIVNAEEQYKDYLQSSEETGRVYRLIDSIESDDFGMMFSDSN